MFDAEQIANEKFYEAFNTQNLNLMQEVWHEDVSIVCVHPGWSPLKGYEAIIKSWDTIFHNTDNLEIKLSHVEIISSAGLAWINCQENLFSITTTGVQASKVHATNLFKKIGNHWKIILHHASSIPSFPLEDSREN